MGTCTQTCEHPYAAAANPLGALALPKQEGFEEADALHTLRIIVNGSIVNAAPMKAKELGSDEDQLSSRNQAHSAHLQQRILGVIV